MPQLLFLQKHGLLIPITNEIINFLSRNPGIPYSSHEILNSISSSTVVMALNHILSIYNGGFAQAASHIGAAASHSHTIIHTTKICSILHKSEDAFLI